MKKTTIIKTNIESKVELVKAMKNAYKMSDLEDGFVVADNDEHKFVLYEEADDEDDKEPVKLMSIIVGDEAYGTNSATFMREFIDLLEIMDGCDERYQILKSSGVTKAGRNFITAVIA